MMSRLEFVIVVLLLSCLLVLYSSLLLLTFGPGMTFVRMAEWAC